MKTSTIAGSPAGVEPYADEKMRPQQAAFLFSKRSKFFNYVNKNSKIIMGMGMPISQSSIPRMTISSCAVAGLLLTRYRGI